MLRSQGHQRKPPLPISPSSLVPDNHQKPSALSFFTSLPLQQPIHIVWSNDTMARGNQRDKAREANLKKQAGQVSFVYSAAHRRKTLMAWRETY